MAAGVRGDGELRWRGIYRRGEARRREERWPAGELEGRRLMVVGADSLLWSGSVVLGGDVEVTGGAEKDGKWRGRRPMVGRGGFIGGSSPPTAQNLH